MKSIVLHNTYLCMRHAQSTANEKHIIISDPATGISNYGLTKEGERQALEAIVTNKEMQNISYIYTSDFLRAYQTAILVSRLCNNVPVITDARLRERYFGLFEGTNSENYHKVWDMDCSSEYDVACHNVEPIHSVARRMLSFLLDSEIHPTNQKILVVSHGDPLQILYAVTRGLAAHQFKSLPHFANAEIRILPSHFTIPEEYLS
ncbi:MAG: histidine phosphatase family protein [Spirochaetota bacterium]|nr:histidine phosphatase family protein [Spirochaetota bacterium]